MSDPSEPKPRHGVSRSPLPRWTVPVVAVAVLAVSAGVLAMLWHWIDGLTFADADKKAAALLDTVKVAASFAVGGGGLFALYLTARRQRTQELELAQRERVQDHTELVTERNHQHAERVADDARHDAAARRVTEQYGKSVEQLGSDKAHVRLGGLYALERLAQDNADQRQVTMNVLCAYLRMPYKLPDADSPDAVEHETRLQELEVRRTAQRLISTHLTADIPAFWPQMSIDLTGATLVDFVVIRGSFRWASFKAALFTGTTLFAETHFPDHAPFDGATFVGVTNFVSTIFAGEARFKNATFNSRVSFGGLTKKQNVTFENTAQFGGAVFKDTADFESALFRGSAVFSNVTTEGAAQFAGQAIFSGAQFSGSAWFSNVNFQDTVTFTDAVFTAETAQSLPKLGVPTINFHSATFAKGTPPEVEPYTGPKGPWGSRGN